jgi:hypothetical protein
MDDGDSGAARHSSGRPDAAHRLAAEDSRPTSVAWLGVSQISTPPFLEVLYGLLRESVEPARSHVLLKVLIPLLGIERRKPGASRRQVLRCELTDSLFDVMHSIHRRVVFLLCNCRVSFLEHMT